MDRNKRSKSDYFCPVPGKPVSKRFNPKKSLHQRKSSPIVSPRHGGVAQLGERLTGSQEVRGSIPLVSTIVNAKAFGIPKAFFHAKIPRAANPSYANKTLHNLFPMSVHSLLDKRNYQCSSLPHLGFRIILNHRSHPINLHQCEQHPKITPLSTPNERYVVRCSLNQFCYQLVLGYLTLHEFNCARGSSKPQSAGSISIRP